MFSYPYFYPAVELAETAAAAAAPTTPAPDDAPTTPTSPPHLTVVRDDDEAVTNPLYNTEVHSSSSRIPGTKSPGMLDIAERTRVRALALKARRIWSGSVGELVCRELTDYAEFGYRFERNAFAERLLKQVSESDERPTPPAAAAAAA